MSKLQRMNAANRSTKNGEGAYHNNPHQDGPPGGNKLDVVQGKSVDQGRQHDPDRGQTNQGYTGKVSTK